MNRLTKTIKNGLVLFHTDKENIEKTQDKNIIIGNITTLWARELFTKGEDS